MAKKTVATFQCDYICTECGSIANSVSKMWHNEKKFSVNSMYCSECQKETDFIKLDNKDYTQADLESYDFNDLNDFEQFILRLIYKGEKNSSRTR